MVSKELEIEHSLGLRAVAGPPRVVLALAAGTFCLGAIAAPSQAQTDGSPAATPTAPNSARLMASARTAPADFQTLYVDSERGNDAASGLQDQPLQTVTRALEVAPANTVIVLAPGRYNEASGEVFPLQLKSGVTIQGMPGERSRTAIIEGGGRFESPTRSQQNVAVIAADRAGIAQVAISNPYGYGVWVESASPTILDSAFVGNRQTGIYVASGSPRVEGSYFSANQVAGMVVYGASRASILGNTFDSTGDAIRLIDGATPEIANNRMTNNDAGLVLIGNAQPVLRGNQIVGNRRNEVVQVAARTRDLSASAQLVATADPKRSLSVTPMGGAAALSNLVATVPPHEGGDDNTSEATSETAIPEEVEADEAALEAREAILTNMPQPPAEADAVPGLLAPAGSREAALQALQSGLALAPRAVSEDNPDSSVLDRPSRSRRQDIEREERPARPVNSNRLAVPNSEIPIGSGDSAVFAPPIGGVGFPGAPPSRAQALGLYYRVFVAAADPEEQDEVKAIVPDAFRTYYEGQPVMQVGAFPSEDEAEERRELLERNDFDVLVEYSR